MMRMPGRKSSNPGKRFLYIGTAYLLILEKVSIKYSWCFRFHGRRYAVVAVALHPESDAEQRRLRDALRSEGEGLQLFIPSTKQ